MSRISVNGQLVATKCLLGAGVADHHLGQRGGFAAGNHPAGPYGERCPTRCKGGSRAIRGVGRFWRPGC